MDNKVSVRVVSDWPEKFGGAFVSATTELTIKEDCESDFCGNPRLVLMYWSGDNSIRLTLGDQDDFDLAKVYHAKNSAEAAMVFGQLLVFLHSMADKVLNPEQLMNDGQSGELFPKIEGVKMMWEWEE